MTSQETLLPSQTRTNSWKVAVVLTLSLIPLQPLRAEGSDHDHPKSSNESLVAQLSELRGKVLQLEGMMQGQQPAAMDMGMGKMSKMKKMGMGMGMGKMSKMKKMGMGMMGKMKASPLEQSALPGFPGSSHVYHIGATEFFLDHPDHIDLSTAQATSLNQIKEGTLLAQATSERKIEQAEQDLWQLTASGQPSIKKIEGKIQEIGKLNASQRVAFIRAVGKAARVLTKTQREVLSGVYAGKPSRSDSAGKPAATDHSSH